MDLQVIEEKEYKDPIVNPRSSKINYTTVGIQFDLVERKSILI